MNWNKQSSIQFFTYKQPIEEHDVYFNILHFSLDISIKLIKAV